MTYLKIAQHYEECLTKYGDTHQGVDWPNESDAKVRHQVMLGVIREQNRRCSLLDFGCGAAHLLETIESNSDRSLEIDYTGLDISTSFINLCKSKYPNHQFTARDILKENLEQQYDYIICNGVFTEKLKMSHEEMFSFMEQTLTRLWACCQQGLAFNVMSHHVDWQREDLFHVPMDQIAALCKAKLSRHLQIRADYGLYEYTIYVYREANCG